MPIENQVRVAIEAQPNLLLASPGTDLAEAREHYPTTAELDALRQADDAVHLDALARAGLIPGGFDALSGVYYEFERRPILLSRAAAELGVSTESLLLSTELLDRVTLGGNDYLAFAPCESRCRGECSSRNRASRPQC